MRIAIITPGGVDRSGTDRVIPCLLWLIERLVQAGDEVHVFAVAQEPAPARWELFGAQVHNAGRRPRRARLLAMILREHRRRAFDVIHAFWADPSGLIGSFVKRLIRVPLLLTLPGGDVAHCSRIRYGGRVTARGRLKLAMAVRGADIVTVPSEAMQAQAQVFGIAADLVPLGVALDRWPPRTPQPREMGAPIRLLHVASLNAVKDQGTLLKAAALLRTSGTIFTLDIVGHDTLGGVVQRRAQELGLNGAVRFHDVQPHPQLRRWFEAADLLLVSSIHEAGPLVTLEAAVMGVPTVGTSVGHIRDFARDAALAVPIGDAVALAAGIETLAADEMRRIRMAEAAQARALAMDADQTARAFRSSYAALAGGAG